MKTGPAQLVGGAQGARPALGCPGCSAAEVGKVFPACAGMNRSCGLERLRAFRDSSTFAIKIPWCIINSWDKPNGKACALMR